MARRHTTPALIALVRLLIIGQLGVSVFRRPAVFGAKKRPGDAGRWCKPRM